MGLRESVHVPLLVMHIPKTAGTSFRWVVEQQYRPSDLYSLYPGHWPELAALRETARDQPPRAIIGHFRFGLHEYLPTPAKYLTVFRDPIDQVLSHYNHLASVSEGEYQAALPSSITLDEFLTHEFGRNLQTQYLTGLTPELIEADPEGAETRAHEILAEQFLAIGTAEQLTRSIYLFASRLGWRVWSVPKLNPSPAGEKRLRRKDLSKSQLQAIESANRLDRTIHDMATKAVNMSLRKWESLFGIGWAALTGLARDLRRRRAA